jgi:tellurite resistance protein TehA-like permease
MSAVILGIDMLLSIYILVVELYRAMKKRNLKSKSKSAVKG